MDGMFVRLLDEFLRRWSSYRCLVLDQEYLEYRFVSMKNSLGVFFEPRILGVVDDFVDFFR